MTAIEVIPLKKTLLFQFLIIICIFIPALSCKAYQFDKVLNNKSLNSDIAIKEGNIVMISYTDTVSSKTYNDMEIYNIKRLDDFMKNIDKGKKDDIRIVKYGKNDSGTWVNKLYDLNYDGNKIIYVEYDVYSNPDKFIPCEPAFFKNIIKIDYHDGLSYRICYSENKDCAYLISFYKSSIIDKSK